MLSKDVDVKEGRIIKKTQDDVNIVINVSGEGVSVKKGKTEVMSPEGNKMEIDPGNTDGIQYKGHVLKPNPDGTCEIFSVGGVRIGRSKTVYLAMGRVDQLNIGGK